MAPQSEWPQTMMCSTLSTRTAYSIALAETPPVASSYAEGFTMLPALRQIEEVARLGLGNQAGDDSRISARDAQNVGLLPAAKVGKALPLRREKSLFRKRA